MAERPSELLSLDIPCDRNAPALVRGALAEFDDDELSLADGMLVASELVTNAVMHSGCTADHMVRVRASLRRDRLWISVHDPGISGESAQPSLDGTKRAFLTARFGRVRKSRASS